MLISRFLHISDNSNARPRGDPEFDPWARIRPFLDSCNRLFKYHYIPEQTVSFDESMAGMHNKFIYSVYAKHVALHKKI